jgi:hypothetical protein
MAAIRQCLRSFPDDSKAGFLMAGLVARLCGYPTMIPRCTWAFPATEWPLDYIATPVFREELGAGEAWWSNIAGTFFRDDPYQDDPASDHKPHRTFLYRPGTAPLQRPDVSEDEPFRAVARLLNWQINSRHREQMRIAWPKFAFHGECARIDRKTPLSGDVGGQCCRWTAGGFKSCPLQCWSRQK